MAARTTVPVRDERRDESSAAQRARGAVAALEALATQKDRDNLVRFGISAKPAFGFSMANIQKVAKGVGKSHALARRLATSASPPARFIGKDALRDLTRPKKETQR